jgi:hypothetical protein
MLIDTPLLAIAVRYVAIWYDGWSLSAERSPYFSLLFSCEHMVSVSTRVTYIMNGSIGGASRRPFPFLPDLSLSWERFRGQLT